MPGTQRLRVLFFLDYDDGHGGRFSNSPGLLPLIGHARQSGFDVIFVNDQADLLERVAQDPTVDIVAFSSMERLLPRSVPVARKVRSLRPGLPLFLGGNSIDSFAGDLVATVFDAVATGEGEHVFPALLRASAAALGRFVPEPPPVDFRVSARLRAAGRGELGGALSGGLFQSVLAATFYRTTASGQRAEIGLSGVWFRNGDTGEVWTAEAPTCSSSAETGSAPLDGELDATCLIPWDVVDNRAWEVLEFYTQRGCSWGRCEFCSVADRNIRSLSHDKILEVLRQATAHGIQTVSFSDDLFVQKPEWNRVLLERIAGMDLGLQFRAQTMANRSVWPLLDLMRRAGFVELAFGVETLSPERARFMVKSFDGTRYVQNACETIGRVAAAGICPVLYMILIDPRSTLIEVATELRDSVVLMEDVYRRTGVLPKLSFNPVMLPVMGPVMTSRFPYRTRPIDLGTRVLQVPFEFELTRPLGIAVREMARRTDDMPYRRENLAIVLVYLDAVVVAAETTDDPAESRIRDLREESAQRLGGLERLLNQDIEETAEILLGLREDSARPGWPAGESRMQIGRFGGYIQGLVQFRDLLARATGGM